MTHEDGKSWTEFFKIKGEPDKQTKALKGNDPRPANEDLKDEAAIETGLFI